MDRTLTPAQPTHAELVTLACNWLEGSQRCALVIPEMPTMIVSEQPDALGWNTMSHSVLVECKASRADFLRDRRKAHRNWGPGMGRKRFFMAPAGIITSADLTGTDWGLVEVRNGRARLAIQATRRIEYDRESERKLLIRIARRAANYAVQPFAGVLTPAGHAVGGGEDGNA